MNVLSFGEILWDMIEGEEHLGGAPFNFAAHASQCGAKAYMLSAVGADEFGTRALQRCEALGVSSIYLQTDDTHPTGIVDVVLKDGQPDYFIRDHAAFDFIDYSSWRKTYHNPCQVFYFGSLAQRTERSAITLYEILDGERFAHVFYDVNLRKRCYTAAIVTRSLSYCSILKLNADELPVLSEMLFSSPMSPLEFCQRLTSGHGKIKTIIITAAERGAFVFDGHTLAHVPGLPVKVTDAVGAGDAFSAAFMTIFFKTADALRATLVANQVGAFVASHRGAVPSYSAAIRRLFD